MDIKDLKGATLPQNIKERLEELGFTPEELAEAVSDHESDFRDENPAVYCGTYGKYNGGSLDGMWIDLTTFSDYDDFIDFCNAIHADEEDPELMFQDYECFPRSLYSESCFSRDDFESIIDYHVLCEKHGSEAVDAFLEFNDADRLGDFEDAYSGKWDSEEDFAENLVLDCYGDQVSEFARKYFDYEAFARELFMYDYNCYDGHVFRVI